MSDYTASTQPLPVYPVYLVSCRFTDFSTATTDGGQFHRSLEPANVTRATRTIQHTPAPPTAPISPVDSFAIIAIRHQIATPELKTGCHADITAANPGHSGAPKPYLYPATSTGDPRLNVPRGNSSKHQRIIPISKLHGEGTLEEPLLPGTANKTKVQSKIADMGRRDGSTENKLRGYKAFVSLSSRQIKTSRY